MRGALPQADLAYQDSRYETTLEHREDGVQNRHNSLLICVTLISMSALSALAQAGSGSVHSATDGIQNPVQMQQPLLIASASSVPAVAVSDDSGLPDAPSASQPENASSEPPAAPAPAPSPAPLKRSSQGAPPAGVGGPLGVDRTVADRNYFLVTGGIFGASVADAELTLRCLDKHSSCNDVPTSFQSRARLYEVGIPVDFGVAYLTYYMKRKHNHLWFAPAAAVIGGNLVLALRAYRWTGE